MDRRDPEETCKRNKVSIVHSSEISPGDILKELQDFKDVEDLNIIVDKRANQGVSYYGYPTHQCNIHGSTITTGLFCPMITSANVQLGHGCSVHVNAGNTGHNPIPLNNVCDMYRNPPLTSTHIRKEENLPHIAEIGGVSSICDGCSEHVPWCNVTLPPKQPTVLGDRKKAHTIRLECQPFRVSNSVLEDAFNRFGSLIEVYLLPGMNLGLIAYATKQSAEAAVRILNGNYLEGSIIKLTLHNEQNDCQE